MSNWDPKGMFGYPKVLPPALAPKRPKDDEAEARKRAAQARKKERERNRGKP